nr:E3 ubiquitin-protein ligase MARCHF3-like [Pocillopora verrucosa]
MAAVEVTTGTSEMETSTSASAAKVKIVAPCNSDSGASSSRLNEGHQNSLAGRQQRQQRVYNMMKDLQQKHLANMIQGKITDQENSDLSESQSICRICHSSGEEPLITPCYCSGSAKHVHASCLLTWFKKEVKNTCELCRHKVDIKKKGKPYAEWRRPEDKPTPIIWFTVFVVGLFLNVFSISVSASELCTSTACVIFYVVNGFGIILDAALLYCWWTKCLFYWRKWCALNQEWSIVVGNGQTAPQRCSREERSSGRTIQIPHIV